ncbi:hypothetical protein HDU76_007798 [Blyttiomyces sp. JEL0837]|nr:hypothetical protein HDU76_007798 [Blyttiomyces sp. JEL0837]
MGHLISRLVDSIWSGKETMRIIMMGLDGAGKTTILYKLKLGELVKTIPTNGFNIEDVQYKNLNFTVWDIGGHDNNRRLYQHYYKSAQGIIFVIDSQDRNRILEARDELERIISDDELRDVALLIFANKQDLPGAMTTGELIEKLGLYSLTRRDWHVQAACGTLGDGICEGFEWMGNTLKAFSKE